MPPDRTGPDRWNRVFDALAAEPRRRLADALLDVHDGNGVSLPAAAESPVGPTESLRVQLHHRHLPMLEAAGYVEWQREPFRAYRGPRFEELEAVLVALYANTTEIPDHLVSGCETLERRRGDDSATRGN